MDAGTTKWLHYQHLAERFRILLFKKLLNTTGEVDNEGANQLLPFYPGPGGWVVVAFDEVAHSIPSPSVVAAELTAVRRFLVAGWISDQANYHASNADEKHKAVQRSHKITGLMLVVTLVAASLHWLKVAEDPLIENLVICVAIILPAFASAQHAIAGIHDYERIAARSARMADILKGLDRSISEASTEKTLRSEIGRAEHIMATENHEWCVSLSFRRLSLPSKTGWPTNPAPPLTQFFPSQTPLPRLRFLDLAAAGAQFLLAVGPRGLRTPAPGRGGAEPTLRRPSRGGVARGNTQTGCCVVRWSGLPCTGWPAADLAGTRVAYCPKLQHLHRHAAAW